MFIEKMDNLLYEGVLDVLDLYLRLWYSGCGEYEVRRIRYITVWGLDELPEDGFIVEFYCNGDSYKELIGRTELGLDEGGLEKFARSDEWGVLSFAKSFINNQIWYEYPVVWGHLDNVFDDEDDYKVGGKFYGDDYESFKKKFG